MMLRRTPHILLDLLIGLVAVLVILAGVGAWRLSQGPVRLTFLMPYVAEELVTLPGAARLEIDDIILTWAGWDRALDIRLIGARIAARDSGRSVVSLPEVAVSFGVKALMRGRFALKSFDLICPQMTLIRSEEGRIELGLGETDASLTLPIVADALFAPPGTRTPIGSIERISVVRGRLTVQDHALGFTWVAPHIDVTLVKHGEGVRSTFDIDAEFEDQKPRFVGTANYDTSRQEITVAANFEKLRPDLLARQSAKLKPLAAVQLSVDGALELTFQADGTLTNAHYHLSGRKGTVALAPLFPRGLRVASITARGLFEREPMRFAIERLAADLGGPTVEVRATVNASGQTRGGRRRSRGPEYADQRPESLLAVRGGKRRPEMGDRKYYRRHGAGGACERVCTRPNRWCRPKRDR